MLMGLAGDNALQFMSLHWSWKKAGLKAIRNTALLARHPHIHPLPGYHLFPGLLPCFSAFLSLPRLPPL